MNREVRLAKQLLEGKGYNISKKMNDSAPVFADSRTSIDIRGLAQVDREELLDDYAGAIEYKDGVIYADETTIRQIRNDYDLWESEEINESAEEHAGWDYYEHTPGKGPWDANQYQKEYNNELYLTVYPPQEVPGEGYQDDWAADVQGINSGTSIDSYEDGFNSFEEAEAWINSQLEKYNPEGDKLASNQKILQSAIEMISKAVSTIPSDLRDEFTAQAIEILKSHK